MRLLAVETSTLTGAVAILDGERVIGESRLNIAVTHGERLLAAVDALLRAAGWGLADVEALAVAIGPGSFTGLRIGVATMKSLAFATGRPLAGVPTLDALAWTLPFAAPLVCPVLDAKKNEVYAALYRTREGRLDPCLPARALAPAALAAELATSSLEAVVFVGDAAALHAPIFRAALGDRARLAPPGLRIPSAVTVGELGAAALARGESADPDVLTPLYVRPSEAELMRERRSHAVHPG